MQPQIIPLLPCDPKKTHCHHDDTHATHANHRLNTNGPPETRSLFQTLERDPELMEFPTRARCAGVFLSSRILLTPPRTRSSKESPARPTGGGKQIPTQPITTKKPSTINTISNQITNTTPIRKSPSGQFPSKPGITIPKR